MSLPPRMIQGTGIFTRKIQDQIPSSSQIQSLAPKANSQAGKISVPNLPRQPEDKSFPPHRKEGHRCFARQPPHMPGMNVVPSRQEHPIQTFQDLARRPGIIRAEKNGESPRPDNRGVVGRGILVNPPAPIMVQVQVDANAGRRIHSFTQTRGKPGRTGRALHPRSAPTPCGGG